MVSNGERAYIKHVLQILPEHPLIFDVGANVGVWTKLALSLNPMARIHCFEPVSSTFANLTAQGFPPNIVLNQLALSDSPGHRAIYVYKNNLLSSFQPVNALFDGLKKPLRTEDVPVDTVTGYCQRKQIDRVDFLKIDAEGHDFPVLQGAKTMLENSQIGAVQLEYGPGYLDARVFLKDVFDLLAPLRYSVFTIFPGFLAEVPTYSRDLENFRLKNYALIHNDLLPGLRSYIRK